ncbi:uncharacterized protein [Nicotiana tomentosiformis]|uniref:uncharacterized protein n=1 Tax=Nicotiana tomentosiformis TaxID=4098 RepID=UPI00388CB171
MKSFIVKTDERLDAHGAVIKELGIGLRNLERQVGHIATILSERVLGTLPADTKRNPKETVNAMTFRSGQVLKDPTPVQKEVVPEKEIGEQLKIEVDKKKKVKKGSEKKKEETSKREEHEESKHMPALPFPQKLYREKLDKSSFINASLCQVLEGDPYKEEEDRRDLSGQAHRLADQTTIIPKGIVEDVLVWVDKFVFPVDFIVVKMEENKEVPLILGRPFLATGRAILDIHDRKLMLRVGEETMTFEMNVEMGVRKEKPAANVE